MGYCTRVHEAREPAAIHGCLAIEQASHHLTPPNNRTEQRFEPSNATDAKRGPSRRRPFQSAALKRAVSLDSVRNGASPKTRIHACASLIKQFT